MHGVPPVSFLLRRAFLPLLVFVMAWAVYLPRTAVTPQDSDGAELALAALTGGVIHPPGYPLYGAITRLLAAAWPTNPYAVLSAFSAACQAAAAAALTGVALAAGAGGMLAVTIGAAWLLFEPVTRTATDAELFAFHHLLALVVAGAALRHMQSPGKRNLAFLGAACGAAAAHHHAIVLWAPLVAASISASEKGGVRGAAGNLLSFIWWACAVSAALYSLLLLLPYDGANAPFGVVASLEDLTRYLLRTDFGTFSLKSGSAGDELSYFGFFAELALRAAPVILIAPLAQLLFRSGGRALTAGMLGTVALHLFFLTAIKMPPDEGVYGEWAMRFFPMVALPFFVCAALVARDAGNKLPALLVSAAVIVPAAFSAPSALAGSDARSDRMVQAELTEIFREIPRDGIVFAALDRHAMGLSYMRALGVRNDTAIVVTGLLEHGAYRRALRLQYPQLFSGIPDRELRLASLANQLVNAGHFVGALDQVTVPEGLTALPRGLVWQWIPEGHAVASAAVAQTLLDYCTRIPPVDPRIAAHRPLTGRVIPKLFRHQPLLFAERAPETIARQLSRCGD